VAVVEAIQVTINGREEVLAVAPDARLIDVLRNQLGLLSVREACGIGMCGSCTVAIDGRISSACLVLAGQIGGSSIETVDVLERGGQLDPIQEAFIEHNAFQCSYCTPGFLLAARELLDESPQPTRHEIREALAGNLCRCGSYLKIEDAVLDAAQRRAASSEEEGR
jgi:aerobic-type carbon monoxide dehydrogenase small subunit (CoxS/CutS family)